MPSNEDKEFCQECKKMVAVIHQEQIRKEEGFTLGFILDCGHAKERDPLPQELD